MLVILDPGHGGIDPATAQYTTAGKRAHHLGSQMHRGGWFYEGVYNRQVCHAIEARLRELGFAQTVWATSKDALWEDTALSRRAFIANEAYRLIGGPALLLSVHANFFSDSGVSGYEIFTSPGQDSSDRFASLAGQYLDCLYARHVPRLRTDYSDGDLDKEAAFYMLEHTDMPSALLELGFMSSLRDATAMMQPESRADAATAIALAVLAYFSEKS